MMTTPNIEELIDRLRDPQTRGTTGEWFDRAVAADALQSQAERINELEEAAGESSVDAVIIQYHEAAIKRLKIENDTLRAQLEAIAATEPVAWLYTTHIGDVQAFTNEPPPRLKELCKPLFTRPMPAQDVTELVEALADLHRQYAEHPDAFWDWSKARTALSKYKGAK